MQVTVEQRHIDAGVKHSACSCPIALAIREQTECFSMYDVAVDDVFASVQGRSYKFPQEATSFILNFDEGFDVNPLTFSMKEIPVEETWWG